jgi:hypothetical protein
MNTRRLVTLTVLTSAALTGLAARAQVSAAALEWQKPGYVTEVVVVTASRSDRTANTGADAALTASTDAADAAVAADEVTLAWQEPGYVQEVVTVTVNRNDYLEAARARVRELALAGKRIEHPSLWLGTPSR